jgi:HAD superfamily hydrolase (TIGR01509 family)
VSDALTPPVEAVIFDAGETLLLLDQALIAAACRDAGAAHVDVRRVQDALVATREALDAWLLPELAAGRAPPQHAFPGGSVQEHTLSLLELTPAQLRGAIRTLVQADRDQRLWTLVPDDARSTLHALRARGVRLAVVSNSDGRIEAKLVDEGLRGAFEVVLDSHVEGLTKPEPGLFLRCVERLGLPAARCAYVGDIFSIDVEGPRRAGLQGILLDRTGRYRAPASPRAAQLADLLALTART